MLPNGPARELRRLIARIVPHNLTAAGSTRVLGIPDCVQSEPCGQFVHDGKSHRRATGREGGLDLRPDGVVLDL